MWLVTTRGFYSAVEARDDPGTIVVRARVKADLERLRPLLPDLCIVSHAGTDYDYRARVGRGDWARIVATLALDIDYGNFKDAVTAKQGWQRHDVYMRVWNALYGLADISRNWHARRHHGVEGWRDRLLWSDHEQAGTDRGGIL